jgi:hypothetical protein
VQDNNFKAGRLKNKCLSSQPCKKILILLDFFNEMAGYGIGVHFTFHKAALEFS